MSFEDEIELKDLLVQTLAENGCLTKIKAQLRASVFLALEEDIKLNKRKPFLNEKVKSSLDTSEGQLMFCIVKEFLEYFNLQSTLAVFDAESYLGVSYQYNGRMKISEHLGLSREDETVPLLQQVIDLAQQKPKTLEVNLNITKNKFEVVDNNVSNSNISIKTDNNLNGEFSDSSSSTSKENGVEKDINQESIDNIHTLYENGNVDLNRTFVTTARVASNHTVEDLNTNDSTTHENTTLDFQIEEIPVNSIHHISFPSLSEKIDEVTPPVLKELKISPERVKSPPKSEKFKSKNSLNSLSDLPPLNMNKSRSGTILPSLYSKEFREKPNS